MQLHVGYDSRRLRPALVGFAPLQATSNNTIHLHITEDAQLSLTPNL